MIGSKRVFLFFKLETILRNIALLVLFFPHILAEAYASERVMLNEDDLLVVQLSVGEYTDDEPLFVYQSPELTLVPVASIANILSIALQSDVDSLTLSGWLVTESNTFELDLENQRYYVRGLAQTWDQTTQFSDDGFEIYLDLQTAQRLLDVKFDVDVPQLQLRVEEDPNIPVLARLERERKRDLIDRPELMTTPKDYIPNTYEWWSKPQFDFSVGTDLERNRGEVDSRYDLFLQGRADVAKHSMSASYIDADGEEDLRITFSRAAKGPDESLLLGMDRYQLGDIFGLSDPLVFSSAQGRGVRLSRGGKSIEEQGDTITLQGDAPPNWEVELYRNGNLIEFSQTSNDGRYLFESVPVFVGENIFDIRLYGPQGQFREVREVVSTGGTMLQQGEWEYDAWAMTRNKRLIDSSININDPESDLLMAEARYGLSRALSARLGASKMTPTSNTEERKYIFGSLYAGLGGALAQLHYSQDDGDGHAYQLNLQSRLFATNVNADATIFDDFVSDRNSRGDVESELGLRLNRSFFVGLPSAVLADFDARHKKFDDGDTNLALALRTATGWAGYQFSNDLNYFDASGQSGAERADGQLSATRKWEGWRYKGAIDYAISPTGRLSGLSFGASHKFAGNMSYTGSVSHRFEGKDVFSNDHTLSRSFGSFSLSGNAGFNSRGLQYVGITITSSLNYDEGENGYEFSEVSATNTASLQARVFIDENNNGVFDEGEQPVSNIRLKGKSRWRKHATDEQGRMTLKGLENLRIETLEVDEKSIEDPFVKPASGPIHVYAHAGSTVRVDIPLAMTFDIEGSAYIDVAGELEPLAQATMVLENLNGEVLDVTRVEFDGVFLFSGVLPGDYCLRIKEDALSRRDLAQSSEPYCFASDGKDGVVFVDDFILSSSQ